MIQLLIIKDLVVVVMTLMKAYPGGRLVWTYFLVVIGCVFSLNKTTNSYKIKGYCIFSGFFGRLITQCLSFHNTSITDSRDSKIKYDFGGGIILFIRLKKMKAKPFEPQVRPR